jgi:hypothetical protein
LLPVLLAPRHVGLTTRAQPTLYWYLAGDADAHLELMLTHPDAAEPLLELRVPRPIRSGVHALSLAERSTTLEPGVVYEWVATLVPDPVRRWKDRVAYAAVERVTVAPELAAALDREGGEPAYRVYAREGIWYDAIQDLSERIAGQPGDAHLRASRAALLEQVGLAGPARREREAVSP